MYTPVRERHPLSTLSETLSSLFNLRQMQDAILFEFIARFNKEKKVAKTQLDNNLLDVLITNTIEYPSLSVATLQTEMKSYAFEGFMAILFLQALDESKYGNMQDEYNMDYSDKKDNYPKVV